ncbi:MAG TPA: type II secretion system F family protein [Stellaceae bacterium]|nr:type II secretion system F family protein [Stellaceae bacterium]
MPRFHFRALRQSGAEIAGEMVAEDAREAALRLQAVGNLPIEISEPGRAANFAWLRRSAFGERLPARDLVLFTRQFAALAEAGIAVDRALALIAGSRGAAHRARLAEDLLAAVNRGEPLSEACAAHPALARHYAMVIAAGEAQGDIGGALERLATVLERQREINQSLTSALLYPASILVVACVSVTFLLGFVVPRFETLLTNLNRAPPLAMQLLLLVSAGFRLAALPLCLAALALLLFFLVRRRDPEFRAAAHRRLLSLPALGPLLGRIETERLAFLLGNLVAAGVELPAALAATREAMTNEALRHALAAAERGVERGDSLAAALAANALLPELALELVRIGEETGDLPGMLIKAGDILHKEVEATTAQMIGLVAPVSIVVLGLLIGGIALALFGTVMDVYDVAG